MSVYAGQSAAERRTGRRERLLDSVREIVGDGGWSALTVRRVCERAGLTSRYFYESFADRDALAVAGFDAVAAQAAQEILAAVAAAGDTASEKATAAIGAFVELVAGDPSRARVLFGDAPEIAALTERRGQATRTFTDLVAAQARAFYGLADRDDVLVETTAAMLTGGLAQTLLAWTGGTLRSTREELVEHCSMLFVAAGEAAVAAARSGPHTPGGR